MYGLRHFNIFMFGQIPHLNKHDRIQIFLFHLLHHTTNLTLVFELITVQVKLKIPIKLNNIRIIFATYYPTCIELPISHGNKPSASLYIYTYTHNDIYTYIHDLDTYTFRYLALLDNKHILNRELFCSYFVQSVFILEQSYHAQASVVQLLQTYRDQPSLS